MIQFNSDHAIQLRNSIASFQLIYSEEWVYLIQKLQNLQQVWNDTHRLEFEQDFHNLTSTHQQINQNLQHHLQEIDRVTNVIEKAKEQLVYLSENTTISSSTHPIRPSSTPQANTQTQTQTNATDQNKSTVKQDIETTIDRFPNLYNASIATFQSLAKTSVSGFSTGLMIFVMANGIYNFQGVKFFEAIISPKTVINTQASDCDQKSENKVSFNRLLSLAINIVNNPELRTALNEYYAHSIEEELEQTKKGKEDEEKQEVSRQQRQQAQTSAPI